jgi:hypothetical protein
MADCEMFAEEGEGVGGRPDEDVMVLFEATHERAHPRRVAAAFTAQADDDP